MKDILPPYRHREEYEWNEEYQKRKFYTEKDFEDEERLFNLQTKGFEDAGDKSPRDYLKYEYKNRYNSLKQNTNLGHNLIFLSDLRWNSTNYSQYVVKASLNGIDEKYVKFELLYHFFGKRRWVSYDYWDGSEESMKLPGYDKWLEFVDMCKEAFRDGHKCCSYKEFIEKRF